MKNNHELLHAYVKKIFILGVDVILVLVLLPLALYLRLETPDFKYLAALLYPNYYFLAFISYLLAFGLLKTHRVIFRLANIFTALRVTFGAVVGAVIFFIFANFVFHLPQIPRSVFFIQVLLFVPASGFFRFYFRIVDSFSHRFFKNGIPTLVYGAGVNTSRLLPSLLSARSEFKIFGVLDDALFKKGSDVQGVKVLGSERDIPRLIETYGIEQVIISMPSASGERIRNLVRNLVKHKLKVKILPSPESALLDPSSKENAIRDIKIEDLLKRAPRSIDKQLIQESVAGKVILVTGAGGSIGSELVRQILTMNPKEVILNDASEYALYTINEEVSIKYPHMKISLNLSNMADEFASHYLFKNYQIDIVFHACAYKHVPLVEANISSAFINNIKSAINVYSLACKYQIEKVILISSDKAVRPTNVMGATKRVCELLLLWYSQHERINTNFSGVRFGNVLGSNGSVVPKFVEQIRAGGPITITDPEITRYFMLIPEAVSLVLQAGTSKTSGEVFVLNMGAPIKILDMARDLIQLMGKEPDEDIKIEFTGLRPGEKLFEELNLEFETLEEITTDYSRITDAIHIEKTFMDEVLNIIEFAKNGEEAHVKKLIFSLISKYEKARPLRKILSVVDKVKKQEIQTTQLQAFEAPSTIINQYEKQSC